MTRYAMPARQRLVSWYLRDYRESAGYDLAEAARVPRAVIPRAAVEARTVKRTATAGSPLPVRRQSCTSCCAARVPGSHRPSGGACAISASWGPDRKALSPGSAPIAYPANSTAWVMAACGSPVVV